MTGSNSDSAALEQRALAAYEADRYDEAIDLFRSARSATDDPLKSAELANSLSVILLKEDRNTEALDIVRGTPQVFEAEGDIGRQARATGNLASALEACGELDEAEKAYREAADLLEMSKESWLNLSKEEYKLLFHQSAVERAGYDKLKGNMAFLQKKQESKG